MKGMRFGSYFVSKWLLAHMSRQTHELIVCICSGARPLIVCICSGARPLGVVGSLILKDLLRNRLANQIQISVVAFMTKEERKLV